MIETCAFFWNFRENVNVLNNSAIGDSRSGHHVHQISGVKWQSGTWKKLKEIPLLINFVSLIIVHYSYPSSLTLVEKSFVSRFDTKKSHEIFHVRWWNWSKMKYYKTFKRSNFQVISQFIHVQRHFQSQWQWKSIEAKANTMVLDKKLFLMGFTASKIYFYFGTISMFWNLKATISHEFQYLNYSKH
jgi:hypothetical protein